MAEHLDQEPKAIIDYLRVRSTSGNLGLHGSKLSSLPFKVSFWEL